MESSRDVLFTPPSRKCIRSRGGSDILSCCSEVMTPTGKTKIAKRKIIRFAQGAGESAYREVVHVSPQKMASLQKIISSEGRRIEVNLVLKGEIEK